MVVVDKTMQRKRPCELFLNANLALNQNIKPDWIIPNCVTPTVPFCSQG